MCKALSPSEFLAISFNMSKKNGMLYEELEGLRQKLTKAFHGADGDSYDVDWGHDAVRFTMGFYSPIFREEDDGILCNRDELNKYYHKMLSGLQRNEQERLEAVLA